MINNSKWLDRLQLLGLAGAIIFGFLPDFIEPYDTCDRLTPSGWIVMIGFVIFLILTLISTYKKNVAEKELRNDVLALISNNEIKNLHSLNISNTFIHDYVHNTIFPVTTPRAFTPDEKKEYHDLLKDLHKALLETLFRELSNPELVANKILYEVWKAYFDDTSRQNLFLAGYGTVDLIAVRTRLESTSRKFFMYNREYLNPSEEIAQEEREKLLTKLLENFKKSLS